MPALATTARFDRAFLLRLADYFAVGVAVALPWSTSATSILIVLWLIAVLPALDAVQVKREFMSAAGGLPVLLWCLGALGMLWADVSWPERFAGLSGFHRLLVIPLLLAHFRLSERGTWVLAGFFASSAGVLVASFAFVLAPGMLWPLPVTGVPVHDDIFQGSAFLICGLGALGYAALERDRLGRRATGLLIAVGILFLANFAFVTISRITLLVAPVLIVLFGSQLCRWKGAIAGGTVIVVAAAVLWVGSPAVRARMHASVQEIEQYRATGAATSIGMHAAFLKESLPIIMSAPVIGHGTGSIPEQFRRMTAGETGAAGVVTVNPHNQTFAVAIQLGALGALVLWAMWIAHFLLFRGGAIAAWLGTVVVVENVVSSVAHSHLFDFNNGWLYVFGVGVLGGMMLRERGTNAG